MASTRNALGSSISRWFRSAPRPNAHRSLFSLPPGLHYLNCAYMAPASKRVADAGRRQIGRISIPSNLATADFFEPATRVRRLFARLVSAPDSDRVAIVPSVSYAMATVARNTPLAAGQAVVVVEEQFPSAVYTWRRACRAAGATLRTVAAPDTEGSRGEAWNEALLDAIDERTAAVVLPPLHWTDGLRFDLDAIGERARGAGARLIVDGTPSVGAQPFDVTRTRPDALILCRLQVADGSLRSRRRVVRPRLRRRRAARRELDHAPRQRSFQRARQLPRRLPAGSHPLRRGRAVELRAAADARSRAGAGPRLGTGDGRGPHARADCRGGPATPGSRLPRRTTTAGAPVTCSGCGCRPASTSRGWDATSRRAGCRCRCAAAPSASRRTCTTTPETSMRWWTSWRARCAPDPPGAHPHGAGTLIASIVLRKHRHDTRDVHAE